MTVQQNKYLFIYQKSNPEIFSILTGVHKSHLMFNNQLFVYNLTDTSIYSIQMPTLKLQHVLGASDNITLQAWSYFMNNEPVLC